MESSLYFWASLAEGYLCWQSISEIYSLQQNYLELEINKISKKMGKIIDNYNLQSQLGSGVYSTVYKAVNMKTKQIVAIKMVKTDKFRELPKLQQGTINQINILSNLEPCEHIIKYYDMLKTVNNFYFVYEFCNGGTLEQMLKKVGQLKERKALQYFRQMTEAFKILNKHNIMHRDLKPENILLHDGVLKIADFGFCKVLENQEQMVQTMLGSPIYMAPEILRGENYTIKADVWSLGVILFRMIFGFCPFESCSIAKLIMRIESDDLTFPQEPRVSSLVIQLLMRMLVKDASKRASWTEIFRFEINEDGEIQKSKEENSPLFKNKSSLMKASTTVSSNGSTFNSLGSDMLGLWNTQSTKDISTAGKTKLKSRPSIRQNPKQFFGQFGQNSKPPTNDDSLSMTSSHAHTAVNNIRKSSMVKERPNNSKMQSHIKNHMKYADLIGLCIQVCQYQQQSGYALAYIITKDLEKEWKGVFESVKKECLRDYQDMNAQETYGIIMEELEHLSVSLQMYEQEITLWSLETLDKNRRTLLKEFICCLRLDSLDQLVMASRIVDFIEESLLIRRETYEKLSKEQLARQIRTRFGI